MLWPAIMTIPTVAIVPAGQVNERGEHDHRSADCEDDLEDQVVKMEIKRPAQTHDGEFDKHQPTATRGLAIRSVAVVVSLRSGWSCYLVDPARVLVPGT